MKIQKTLAVLGLMGLMLLGACNTPSPHGKATLTAPGGVGQQAQQPTVTVDNPFDFDGSGCVDGGDLQVLAAAFGTQQGDPGYNFACDLSGDGLINGADFNLWRPHVGEGCGL